MQKDSDATAKILYIYKVVVFLILGAFLLILSQCEGDPEPPKQEIIRDTIYREIAREPITIYRTVAQVEKIRDTIIESPPFVARMDTVIGCDTISTAYEFPENLVSLSLRSKPDSVPSEVRTIILPAEKSKWWEKPAIALLGVAVGLMIGR